MSKSKKIPDPLYGTIGSMGHINNPNVLTFYVNCPEEDNTQLEGYDPKRDARSERWLGAVVEIRMIRPREKGK